MFPGCAVTAQDIDDHEAAVAATFARDATSAGICVADGFGMENEVVLLAPHPRR